MSNHEYPVSDLGTASYLCTTGLRLLRLDRRDSRRVLFVFEHTPDIERVIEGYWNGTARVAPLALQLSQKTLKARILSEQPL